MYIIYAHLVCACMTTNSSKNQHSSNNDHSSNYDYCYYYGSSKNSSQFFAVRKTKPAIKTNSSNNKHSSNNDHSSKNSSKNDLRSKKNQTSDQDQYVVVFLFFFNNNSYNIKNTKSRHTSRNTHILKKALLMWVTLVMAQ